MLCTVNCMCKAQELPPLKRSIQLVSNFGELRTNHFHSGVDLRAAIGTPVYSIDSGYVSRISVKAGGYGNALYITHPSGKTSVYAHLNSFIPKIEDKIKQEQYRLKTFAVDIPFAPEDIKVERGELVAYTGNRGQSGGPHLHFEIRDTQTEELIDPLIYLKDKIKDTRPPQIKAIAVIPYNGVVNKKSSKTIIDITSQKGVNKEMPKTEAWGEILLAVKSYDYADGMNNIYGVRNVSLYKDEELIYSSCIDTISFETTRQINSYIDREEWMKTSSPYMVSYIAPVNSLKFYEQNKTENRGIVTIDEERTYKFRYELSDYYGNKTTLNFKIEGKKSNIPSRDLIPHQQEHTIEEEQFKMEIPAYALYDDYSLNYTKTTTLIKGNYSVIHRVEPYYAGVDKECTISIKVETDTIPDKSKYYIATINSVGKNIGKISQTYKPEYKKGWLTAQVKTFGQFVVKADNRKPYIKYHGVVDGEIRLTVKDDESGIKHFSGEINGEWELFTYDVKDKIARYKIDTKKYIKGRQYEIKFYAIDNCGNKKEVKYKFIY